jgi:hypothetical protein
MSVSVVLDKDLFTCETQHINPRMLETLDLLNKSIELENRQKECAIKFQESQNHYAVLRMQFLEKIQRKILDANQMDDYNEVRRLTEILNSAANNKD